MEIYCIFHNMEREIEILKLKNIIKVRHDKVNIKLESSLIVKNHYDYLEKLYEEDINALKYEVRFDFLPSLIVYEKLK